MIFNGCSAMMDAESQLLYFDYKCKSLPLIWLLVKVIIIIFFRIIKIFKYIIESSFTSPYTLIFRVFSGTNSIIYKKNIITIF